MNDFLSQRSINDVTTFSNEPEPDFQIDCNFTNLMCKTLRMYE